MDHHKLFFKKRKYIISNNQAYYIFIIFWEFTFLFTLINADSSGVTECVFSKNFTALEKTPRDIILQGIKHRYLGSSDNSSVINTTPIAYAAANISSFLPNNLTNSHIAIEVNRTLIAYPINSVTKKIECKNNLILKLLPDPLTDQISDYINEFPEEDSLSMCRMQGEDKVFSCCNRDTINLFSDYLVNNLIEIKKQIFANNAFYFSLIKNEHYRNFIEGFGISEADFELLFEEFQIFKLRIYNLTQAIIQESVRYTWNSLCNYVCRSDFYLLYKVYNITSLKNNTYSYDFFFEFTNDDKRILSINDLLSDFFSLQTGLNLSLNDIYNRIISKSKNFNYTYKGNDTEFLITKSLEDGRNLFFNLINNDLPCSDNYNLTKVRCDEIISLKSLCKPFQCLDNIFLQFIDTSSEPIDYNLITNYKYDNSTYSNFPTVAFIVVDSDIKQIISDNIQFVNNCIFIKPKILDLLMLIIFIFFI